MDPKTFFKKLNYSWKRLRRRLSNQATSEELADKLPKLRALYELHKQQFIDLFFADESGFSLTPYIPYGWQKVGHQVAIKTQRAHVQNVFGLLNPTSKALHTYSTTDYIESNFICQSIDDFATKIRRPTVIILDNAPWHTSDQFRRRIEKWNEQDLYIFHLPKYSPHLNIIETLWRIIKYKWLQPKHYNSKTALKKRLKEIFSQFGSLFDTDFSMNFFEHI